MDKEDIKQRIRLQSIQNAEKQGITYSENPAWISTVSWWIGGVTALISFFAAISLLEEQKGAAFLAGPFYGLLFKGLSYAILCGIYYGGKYAKQGVVSATKEGGKLLDNATTVVAKKITIAIEKGKREAEIEQEKHMLNKQVADLELQYLRKRVEELEKRIDGK